MVMDDGGDQSVVNIYVKLQCCTPETYILKILKMMGTLTTTTEHTNVSSIP